MRMKLLAKSISRLTIEKRDGIWKMVYRSEIVDWSRTEPTHEPYFDSAPDCFRGGRQDDRVYDTKDRYNPN